MRMFMILFLSVAAVAHALTPSQMWRDYYSPASIGPDGAPLPIGTLIQAFDPQGVECGRFVVDAEGEYGYLHVYGDDPLTPSDEGAAPGDTVRFLVDGVPYLAAPPAVWVSGDRFQYRADLYPESTTFLTGRVVYGGGLIPIPNVSLELDGPTPTTLTTNDVGRFVYGPLLEAHYRLTMTGLDPGRFDGTVTAFDASLILWHVLAGGELTAAPDVYDATGDGTITAYDASEVLKYTVGVISAFAPGELWVSADSIVFDYAPGTYQNAEFFVQRIGDVSGNWSEAPVDRPAAPVALNGTWDGGSIAYRISDCAPIYALSGRIEGAGSGAHVAVPDGWLVEMLDVGTGLVFSMAGATPLNPELPIIVSDTPIRFRGTANENLAVAVSNSVPIQRIEVSASPNPFNAQTLIRYTLFRPGSIRLTVHNVTGQQVRTFGEGQASAGTHEATWDGRDDAGRDVSSGVYLYRIVGDRGTAVGRVLLVR